MHDFTVRRWKFLELSEEAQEVAIENYTRVLDETLDSEMVNDILEDALISELGAMPKDLLIEFSLSYSQGDGVAFYGNIEKEEAPLLTWGEDIKKLALERTSLSGFYSHYNTFAVEAYNEDEEEIPFDRFNEDLTTITEQLRDISKRLEKVGYEFIGENCGVEHAAECLIEEDAAVFLEDGRRSEPVGVVE